MYKMLVNRLETLTARWSERLLTINNFPGQRTLKPEKVNEISSVIRDGLFLVGEVAVAILAYKNNERVLLNGQHQCNAVIATNTSVTVVYEEYRCETPEDASLLFRQFDNSGVRALHEKVKVEVDSLGLSWPKKIASLVVSGATYGKRMTANEKVETLKHHLEFGRFLNNIIGDGENRKNRAGDAAHMKRVPVVFAMLQTFNKNREASIHFWTQVRDGEGLKRDMPSYKLRNFLLTHNYGFGHGAIAVQNATLHEMVSRCITAWNAYRKSVSTDLKYYMDKPIPKPI